MKTQNNDQKTSDKGLDGAACSPKYFAGMTCQCGAYNENECGCPDVDWTPSEVYRLRALLTDLCDACDGIDCADFMPTGMPEAYEAARNYLQENSFINRPVAFDDKNRRNQSQP